MRSPTTPIRQSNCDECRPINRVRAPPPCRCSTGATLHTHLCCPMLLPSVLWVTTCVEARTCPLLTHARPGYHPAALLGTPSASARQRCTECATHKFTPATPRADPAPPPIMTAAQALLAFWHRRQRHCQIL
eukprot:XP_001699385.1 predicted protein [Chlamydomonas reinhardtii]